MGKEPKTIYKTQSFLITHIKNIDKSYFREMAEKCTFLFKKGRNMRLTSF